MSKQKSLAKWRRDRTKVKANAGRPNPDASPHCMVPGCGRPTQAHEGRGFSKFHCRYHVQWNARHGSFWKGTYRAAELLPYRRAAEQYLREHTEDKWIKASLGSLENALRKAGPVQRMPDIMVMRPADKARAALARLRDADVTPKRLLIVFLTISATIMEDPIRPGGEHGVYLRTQVGKAAHRLASGYHTDYGFHRYPRSSGLVLRELGGMIEEACEWIEADRVRAVVDLKIQAAGPRLPSPPPPFPRSRFATQGVPRGW